MNLAIPTGGPQAPSSIGYGNFMNTLDFLT